MTLTLRLLSLVGLLLFSLLFAGTFLSPKAIEQGAQHFIQAQIAKEIKQQQQRAADSGLAANAKKLSAKLGIESARLQQKLDQHLPAKIAAVIATMCHQDCDTARRIERSMTQMYQDELATIHIGQQSLDAIIQGKYQHIVQSLKRDLRIFLGANLAMFMLVLLASFTRPAATAHLFVPALLLIIATLVASGIYLFGQNWFYTIVFNHYMGFSYLLYLGLIFGLMLDIVLNRGRITCEIVNAIANAIGSSFSLVLC